MAKVDAQDRVPANSLSSQESSNQDAQGKQSSSDKSAIAMADSTACEDHAIGVNGHAAIIQSLEDKQEDTFPLSGKPFFTCILVKSSVQKPFQLAVPRRFINQLPEKDVPVTLHCRNKTWEIGYNGAASAKRFDSKWKFFAIDNKLKIGDACIFELMDAVNIKFRVQILDGSLPEPFRPEAKGVSFDAPILIDD